MYKTLICFAKQCVTQGQVCWAAVYQDFTSALQEDVMHSYSTKHTTMSTIWNETCHVYSQESSFFLPFQKLRSFLSRNVFKLQLKIRLSIVCCLNFVEYWEYFYHFPPLFHNTWDTGIIKDKKN